jgi:Mlc titration factor MtfA (ptsG expression regulator)
MITKLLDWLRGRRRPAHVPDELWQQTVAGLPFLAELSADEQTELRALTERFLAEKEFATAGGLELTNAMCVTIAAQGCLLVLKLGLEAYRGWVGIVVYPDEFVIPRTVEDEFGVVHEYHEEASGEAWLGGPLIVSWRDAQMAGGDYNVVIHEFAHKLDMLDGEADGIPALHSDLTRDAWDEVLLAAYDDFCRRVDSGENTLIDPYASENPSEFFAVLSESFFGMPAVVADEYRELYDLLRRYYRQDPLIRSTKAATADKTASG